MISYSDSKKVLKIKKLDLTINSLIYYNIVYYNRLSLNNS